MVIPRKYLIKFCRTLDLLLINFEVELDLSWTKDFVLIEFGSNIRGGTLQQPVSIVALSIERNIKF